MNTVSLSDSFATTSVAANLNTAKIPAAAAEAAPSVAEDATWSSKNFSQNVDQFKSLTGILLDTSGKYSHDERLKAHTSLFEMAVKGKLAGMAADDQKLYEKASSETDIAIKAAKIQQQAVDNHLAARARGENTGVAYLKYVAGLSETDQKTYFALNENGFDMSGSRQYVDIDAYRNQLVANAVHEYVSAGGKAQSQGKAIKGDPAGIAQALKGMDSATLGKSWSAHILSLLNSDQAVTSDWKDIGSVSMLIATPKMPASYQPGNIFTRVA